jgi:hypothetical protein
MQKWKAVSWGITSLAVANLTAMVLVFLLHLSRLTALKLFLVFRVSAGALLLLIPAEFLLRRMQGKEYGPVVLNGVLVALMFLFWLIVAAATF